MPRDGLPEVDQVVSNVAGVLKRHAADLPKLYQFGLPDGLLDTLLARSNALRDRFEKVNEQTTPYERTLLLRQEMPGAFEEFDNETKRFLVGWILKWGGIDGNAADEDIDTVIELGDAARDNLGAATFTRIASWSKYAAFREPESHAILDSRVVHALNWLLFTAKSTRLLPNNVPGRNTLLDLLDYWPLVLAARHEDLGKKICEEAQRLEEDGGRSRLVNELSRRIAPRKGAYAWYLDLMQEIAGAVFPSDKWRLLKTEMLLFAGATTFIAQDVAGTLVPLWNSARKG